MVVVWGTKPGTSERERQIKLTLMFRARIPCAWFPGSQLENVQAFRDHCLANPKFVGQPCPLNFPHDWDVVTHSGHATMLMKWTAPQLSRFADALFKPMVLDKVRNGIELIISLRYLVLDTYKDPLCFGTANHLQRPGPSSFIIQGYLQPIEVPVTSTTTSSSSSASSSSSSTTNTSSVPARITYTIVTFNPPIEMEECRVRDSRGGDGGGPGHGDGLGPGLGGGYGGSGRGSGPAGRGSGSGPDHGGSGRGDGPGYGGSGRGDGPAVRGSGSGHGGSGRGSGPAGRGDGPAVRGSVSAGRGSGSGHGQESLQFGPDTNADT